MTEDSTSFKPKADVTITNNMNTPKISTISYIRQFACAYRTLRGTAFSTMIAN